MAQSVSQKLLRWYDRHARILPWRAGRGETANPYHVLLSEFMLQQTGVATVIPYFHKFTKRFPSLRHLAAATLEDVRTQWAGLGYYRRAAFLHRCAQAVVAEYKGTLPPDEESLLSLPGIGPYTAAAIAAIAFGQKANVVDGNVERVITRLFAIGEALPKARPVIREKAGSLLPQKRCGDYAQALMDLGATVCTPRKPDCPACPLQTDCAAHRMGKEEAFPVKAKTAKTPEKRAAIFVVTREDGQVLLRRRPEAGLLGGMWEFPSTPWQERLGQEEPAAASGRWQRLEKPVVHVFSHFRLTLAVHLGHGAAAFLRNNKDESEYRWMRPEELDNIALPTVMRKVAHAANLCED
jgi:A/G-specific adenine glycosylase